jgi:hypothetical protein
MKPSLATALGLVLVLLGLVWTAQGVGWLHGSPMTDESFWAFAGVVTALAGIALVGIGVRRSHR